MTGSSRPILAARRRIVRKAKKVCVKKSRKVVLGAIHCPGQRLHRRTPGEGPGDGAGEVPGPFGKRNLAKTIKTRVKR